MDVVRRRGFAPGRVNVMGDHVDHFGGMVLPMAVHLGTTVTAQIAPATGPTRRWEARSGGFDGLARGRVVAFDDIDPRATAVHGWAGLIHAAVAAADPPGDVTLEITSTLPVGAGMSSSASVVTATLLALGHDPTERDELAEWARAVEHACGVPCGVMDQLAVVHGRDGHALLIDCAALSVTPTRIDDSIEVAVFHSGVERTLTAGDYTQVALDLQTAQTLLGPLTEASVSDADTIADPVVRARARHGITEHARTPVAAAALAAGDTATLAEVVRASQRSLRDDAGVSLPAIDQLVSHLERQPGVIAARITGAGFGGCVVAFTEAGSVDPSAIADRAWLLAPAAGARLVTG